MKHLLNVGLTLVSLLVLAGTANRSSAQGTGVPVYAQGGTEEERIKEAAGKLREAGALVRETALTNQLDRTNCTLELPKPGTTRLAGRDLWTVARTAHLRIGWYFHCTKCEKWHLGLGAGYALTKDGAVATCFHVVRLPDRFKEGYLIAADEDGKIYPVTEILAANPDADACILRIQAKDLKPLPLNTAVFPGDRCVCFSDPLGQRGYYTDGIVSRFVHPSPRSNKNAAQVTRLDVTTDWAPGSSGAAILDECGNAIGHVTAIATLSDRAPMSSRPGGGSPTLITIHEAVSAKDVRGLVGKPAK